MDAGAILRRAEDFDRAIQGLERGPAPETGSSGGLAGNRRHLLCHAGAVRQRPGGLRQCVTAQARLCRRPVQPQPHLYGAWRSRARRDRSRSGRTSAGRIWPRAISGGLLCKIRQKENSTSRQGISPRLWTWRRAVAHAALWRHICMAESRAGTRGPQRAAERRRAPQHGGLAGTRNQALPRNSDDRSGSCQRPDDDQRRYREQLYQAYFILGERRPAFRNDRATAARMFGAALNTAHDRPDRIHHRATGAEPVAAPIAPGSCA